jgi:hypothetical protein
LTHIDCWTASKFKASCFVYLAAEIRDPAGIGVQEIFCFFIIIIIIYFFYSPPFFELSAISLGRERVRGVEKKAGSDF